MPSTTSTSTSTSTSTTSTTVKNRTTTRKFSLKEISRCFWDHHVEPVQANPDCPKNHFRLLNTNLPDIPTDIQVIIPQTLELDGRGQPLNPIMSFTDHHSYIATALGQGFCGYRTYLIFGHFDALSNNYAPRHPQVTHSFIPCDPIDATHIWVHTLWDLSIDARKIPVASLPPKNCVYEFSHTHWDESRGAVHYILQTSDDLTAICLEFQDQLTSVRQWSARRLAEFAKHKNEFKSKLCALSSRAEAVGWKLVFGEKPDSVSVVTRDTDTIHTTYVRYDDASYRNFIKKLERAEALTDRYIDID